MPLRTRKSSTERRAEIVQAVLRIIGERGLTSLSTAAIAEEVGVTSGALFRHFPTLDAVYRAVLQYAVARIDASFPDTKLSGLERLLALARNRVRLFRAEPGLAWLLRSDQAYLTLPGAAVDELRDVVERSKEFLVQALRDGAADGDIRSDLTPTELLLPVMGTIHALVGSPGIHRLVPGIRQPHVGRALATLGRLLAPASRSPTNPRRSPRSAATRRRATRS